MSYVITIRTATSESRSTETGELAALLDAALEKAGDEPAGITAMLVPA